MKNIYANFAILQYIILNGILVVSLRPHPCHSNSGRAIPQEKQKEIDDFVNNVYLPASKISGMGLAIVQNNGEVLYTTGYGLADRENNIRNSNSTQFSIGSVTKSFTALLVIKLLNVRFPAMGEAVLDTPIRKLVQQANFTLVDRFRSEDATFRDLLGHRLCLNREDLPLVADPFNTTEEIVYRTRYSQQKCGIRSEFQYNNQIYVVAGELAGILANASYEDAMQDLLKDIGMTNASFVQRTDDPSQLPFRAKPYYVMDNETHPLNPELVKRVKLLNSAGGLFVSPNDISIYMQFHLNMGKNLKGKQVIPREVMEWTREPSIAVNSYSFKTSEDSVLINAFGYGLGLILSSYDGWSCIQHGGYFTPYSSLMTLYPDKKIGIFSSTNMGPVLESQQVLHAFIFETIKGGSNATEKVEKLKESLNAEKVNQADEILEEMEIFNDTITETAEAQDIVGTYGSGSIGDVDVSEQFNQQTNQTAYYLQYGRWFKGWLQQNDSSHFIYKLTYDTDIVQDSYALGVKIDYCYVAFVNGTLTLLSPLAEQKIVMARFKLGETLDNLPKVPFSPDSCGPEE